MNGRNGVDVHFQDGVKFFFQVYSCVSILKVYAAEYNAGIVELQGSNGEKEFCFFTAKASTEIQLQILFADTGMLFVAFYNTCLLLADHSFYMLNKTHSESKI